MKSTYNLNDVEFLLTDVTGKVPQVTVEEKKERVNRGEYPRSILIEEYKMDKKYLDTCLQLGQDYIKQTAIAVGNLAEQLYKYKTENLVLVSIVRSGIPIGILVKRYLKNKYNIDVYHYAISLIEGLDKNGMKYILSKHKPEYIQFIDSWTGKGTVTRDVINSAKDYEGVDASLAVLSDCLNLTKYCGIREDIAIPQAPINACITGLVSMPIHNNPFVGKENFDGAIYLEELEEMDVSQKYLDLVEKEFDYSCNANGYTDNIEKVEEITKIAKDYNVNLSQLNPGINEAARAILRRKVAKLLVKNKNDFQVKEIIELAKLKNIEIEEYDFKYYKASSIAID